MEFDTGVRKKGFPRTRVKGGARLYVPHFTLVETDRKLLLQFSIPTEPGINRKGGVSHGFKGFTFIPYHSVFLKWANLLAIR